MGDITKIKVWNSSLDLVTEIFVVTNKGTLSKDFSLRDQISRAAVSVPSNIAEEASSGFDNLGIRYFLNARVMFETQNSDYHCEKDQLYYD